MSDSILSASPLGFPWQTPDPFLFCAYHRDDYPPGNPALGPAASLAGREIGNDFEGREGWRMYHGQAVPGFPAAPHRGFETVTVVRRGLIDHSDSLGATARFGGGDAQWLTAGRGIVHSEMFPLIRGDAGNPLELFQIWLNLPAADKLAEPHFSMLWQETIPKPVHRDAEGRNTEVTVVAGDLGEAKAPPPPPHSWAADEGHDVAIWTVRMDPHATWNLPPAAKGSNRHLYFFEGQTLKVDAREFRSGMALALHPEASPSLVNGASEGRFLLLQGKPIGETVVQYGPFVMNTRREIEEAFADYQRAGFGGWPWPNDEPVHGKGKGRFARHADGHLERPLTSP